MGTIKYKTQLWKRIVYPNLYNIGYTIIEVPNEKGYWKIVDIYTYHISVYNEDDLYIVNKWEK